MSGIGAGVVMQRAGDEDFVVLERADELGGTWRDNTYPGCACDVPLALLLVLLRAEPDWSRALRRPGGDPRATCSTSPPSTACRPRSGCGADVLAGASGTTARRRWLIEHDARASTRRGSWSRRPAPGASR